MSSRRILVFAAVFAAAFAAVAAPAASLAQHGAAAPAARAVPREASQFDFLVGQWDVVATPAVGTLAAKLHGVPKLPGSWKAWRGLDGWGIEDELRLTDESGNPRSLSHALRVYDANAKQWSTSMLDVYRGSFTASTSEWSGREMVSTSRATDAADKTVVTRTRYYDITPASFRFQQDRSADGGRTWTEGVLRIDAKRVAATAPR